MLKCEKCNSKFKKVNIRYSKQENVVLCENCYVSYIKQENKKYCIVCNQKKPLNEFHKTARSLDNRVFYCKSCFKCLKPSINKDRNFLKKLRLKLDVNYSERVKFLKRENSIKNHVSVMLSNAKKRAQLKGLEFNLTKEDIVIPEKCPILNVPFVSGRGKDYFYTPTIDRIDNSKGYTKNNIQVISMKANTMKNSASIKELITFSKYILENSLRYSPNNTEDEGIES